MLETSGIHLAPTGHTTSGEVLEVETLYFPHEVTVAPYTLPQLHCTEGTIKKM